MSSIERELAAWLLMILFRAVVFVCVAALVVSCFLPAKAATELPDCDPAIPQPPFVFVLPDGSEVAVTRWEYQLDSRRVVLIGNDRVFCDGLEGEGL